VAVFTGEPALAETGNGSKNFHAPASVPNYFSNEAGPMLGGPSESRRVDLYPNPATAPRQVDTVTAPPSARNRHIATRHGRAHLAARTRGGRHPVAARDHTRTHVAVRGGPPSHAKHAAVSHTTHVSSAHHRGRG
jgi:hypothetical protein